MSEQTFMVGGRIVEASEIKGSPARPKAKADLASEFHRGWIVEGFRPGVLEEAERLSRDRFTAWLALTDEARIAKLKDGGREPKPWDEDEYAKRGNPVRVRSRPFQSLSSAEQCSALASRSGWRRLRVVELSKGTVPPPEQAFGLGR